ncbi:ABC transporter ATP-binding protein [Actinokineospora diospyrosa]|uniref:ABC-type nitrate/sulfonate/bicarbonate transport system, ATPase component n=1 Tax=Actinokineospora diospyrosa TaxID=103728 RepID=A0ABT1I6Q4_9PSEU|nr:ABC transporter ATP-binding protein [Actinokineospora diospyrosa]MCP2268081.1 ABC-type nitrate/sulfonate/bicarbonate transport system, ATPase component [Actinokineospora diospyrosa]
MTPDGAGVGLDGVAHRFGDVDVLRDIAFTVEPRRSLGVIGPSGCGKSTLLTFIAGLAEPGGGSVRVGAETAPAGRLAACALMPQKDLLLPWRRAIDNAALALENRGVPRKQARARVAPLFERFNLGGFEQHWPHELSGGMRQRVAFLRTLVADKDVLLLDEPFGGLDAITRADMQDWLRGVLTVEPRTAVLVTHDVEEALLLCHEVVVLTPRPATVVARIEVDLPVRVSRAETIADPAFTALRARILSILAQGSA